MDWVFRSFADAGTDIRVNDQFRITFRLEDGGAWEVRCEDYH
jgi:plasmid maintenance system killer protein